VTPRDYLLTADLDGPATLGLRAVAASIDAIVTLGGDAHAAYAEDMTDDPALLAATLPAIVKSACREAKLWEDDAKRAADAASLRHLRDVAQLHRATVDLWQSLTRKLLRAAALAGVDLSGAL
jgi:hypothetical protein